MSTVSVPVSVWQVRIEMEMASQFKLDFCNNMSIPSRKCHWAATKETIFEQKINDSHWTRVKSNACFQQCKMSQRVFSVRGQKWYEILLRILVGALEGEDARWKAKWVSCILTKMQMDGKTFVLMYPLRLRIHFGFIFWNEWLACNLCLNKSDYANWGEVEAHSVTGSMQEE